MKEKEVGREGKGREGEGVESEIGDGMAPGVNVPGVMATAPEDHASPHTDT